MAAVIAHRISGAALGQHTPVPDAVDMSRAGEGEAPVCERRICRVGDYKLTVTATVPCRGRDEFSAARLAARLRLPLNSALHAWLPDCVFRSKTRKFDGDTTVLPVTVNPTVIDCPGASLPFQPLFLIVY